MTSKRIRPFAALALLALASLHGASRAQAAATPSARAPAVADFSRCPKPVWPLEALRREEQGTVTLQFKVAANGRVEEAKVVNSSGFMLLDAKCHWDGAGVRKDEAEALRLYQLAANGNSVLAIRRMLKAAERGELGLPVDVAAAKWRERLPAGA